MIRRALPPLAALVLLVAVWEIGARALAIPLYVLPPPSAVPPRTRRATRRFATDGARRSATAITARE